MSETEKSVRINNKFLKGTLILTVSSIVVKVIGSLNWIILSRVLGGEGIGLYQMGFPIYLMAITLSSAGIPVAISIITAEKLAQKDFLGAKRVFNVSLRLLFVTGLVFASALFFGAHWLIDNHWIRDSRAYYSIIALAPAVFFVTFLASFRGYLQGWQIMTPTAASEIVEQLMRVVTMIVFADMFMPHGLAYAAGGASMGAGVGAFCALLVLMWFYGRLKQKLKADLQQQNPLATRESARAIISRLLEAEGYKVGVLAQPRYTDCEDFKRFGKPKYGFFIGGGNVAMDAARCAKRMGAEHVYVLYRRDEEEMPARKEEVHHAKEEGIIFDLLTNPISIEGDEKGHVQSMTCIRMELGEPDASGRRRPVPMEGSEFKMEADAVIMALGTSPNPMSTKGTEGLEKTRKGCVAADENGQTSLPGVFAGGDAATGAATVILAMGAGKHAAKSIDAYIKSKG